MLQEILIGTIHPFFACTRVSARVSAYKAFNRCLAFCNWNYISVIQVAIVVSEYPSPKVTLAVAKTARGFHSLAHLAPFEITFQMSSLTNQGGTDAVVPPRAPPPPQQNNVFKLRITFCPMLELKSAKRVKLLHTKSTSEKGSQMSAQSKGK
jgi:hypothetical protein